MESSRSMLESSIAPPCSDIPEWAQGIFDELEGSRVADMDTEYFREDMNRSHVEKNASNQAIQAAAKRFGMEFQNRLTELHTEVEKINVQVERERENLQIEKKKEKQVQENLETVEKLRDMAEDKCAGLAVKEKELDEVCRRVKNADYVLKHRN